MKKPSGQWTALAALRFALAAIVMVSHTRMLAADHSAGFLGAVDQFDAHVAVLGFLMISGYSIAHSITTQPDGYQMRRVRRIYPVWLFALLAGSIVFALAGGIIQTPDGRVWQFPSTWLDFAGALLLVQGVLVAPFDPVAPARTLAAEWLMYHIAPIFRRWPLAVWAAMLLSLSFWTVHAGDNPYGQGWGYWVWPWCLGWIYYNNQDRAWAKALLILLPLHVVTSTMRGCAFADLTVCASSVLIIVAPSITTPPIVERISNCLGEINYPLYLVHWPMIMAVYLTLHAIPVLPTIALSLLVSALVYRFIDKPLRKSPTRADNLARGQSRNSGMSLAMPSRQASA